MSGFTLYDSVTGKSGTLCEFEFKTSVEYLNNLDQKPLVRIPDFGDKDETINFQRTILYGNISSNTDSNIAVSFMARVLGTINGKLDQDWKSYDVMIGHRGDVITPLSLIDIYKEELEFKPVLCERPPTVSDYGILAKCMMIYEIGQAPSYYHKVDVAKRLGGIFAVRPFGLDSTSGVMNVLHWIQDPAYCALIAATDMFFRKFTNHEFEKLTACTNRSFLKDCSMITLLNRTAQALSTTPATLLEYVFTKDIAEDVRRMIGGSSTEEKDVDHSYFQYMRAFNLVHRSPYSARANPNLFMWCQFIMILMGERRSMYSRMLDCANPARTLIYASYIVFYLSGIQTFLSPSQVLQYIKENKWEITSEMEKDFSSIISTIDGSRPGTIGEFVKNYFS